MQIKSKHKNLRVVVGLLWFWAGLSPATLGLNVPNKRVRIGPIVTHPGPACAQIMSHLPKLWSHAHGRQNCYRRVTTNKCNKMMIKEIHYCQAKQLKYL